MHRRQSHTSRTQRWEQGGPTGEGGGGEGGVWAEVHCERCCEALGAGIACRQASWQASRHCMQASILPSNQLFNPKQPYVSCGLQVMAMTNLVAAYQENNIREFEKILQQNK